MATPQVYFSKLILNVKRACFLLVAFVDKDVEPHDYKVA
jgi:hypothetical protein